MNIPLVNSLTSRNIVKNNIFFTAVSVAVSVLIYFNILVVHSVLIGIAALTVFLYINSIFCGIILKSFLPIEDYLASLFGGFFLFYLLSFFGGFFVVFFKFSPFIAFVILFFVPLLLSFATSLVSKKETPIPRVEASPHIDAPTSNYFPKYLFMVLAVFLVSALLILLHSRTGATISSPWQVVNPVYFAFVFIIAFLIFLLTFSRYSVKKILLFAVIFSLLVHSNLLIVYKLGYGGDKWRHLATERQIINGDIVQPSLLDHPIAIKKIGPVSIPLVFVAGNKTSYANQWAGTVFLSYITQIDVLNIDLILGFLLWAVFIPLLFYQLALFFKPENKRFALLLAASTTLFYTLQVYGAITVPYAFGMIFFVFSIMVAVGTIIRRTKFTPYVILLLSIMMCINYILALVLWGIAICLYLLFNFLNKIRLSQNFISKTIIFLLLVVLVTVFISFLDLQYAKQFDLGTTFEKGRLTVRNISSITKNLAYDISGYTLFSNKITTNNVFFILQPNGSYPLNSRAVVVLGSAFLVLFVFAFIVLLFRNKKIDQFKSIILVLLISFLYILFVKNFFLSGGPRPLSNRLDIAFFLLLSIALSFGVISISNKIPNKKIYTIFVSFFLSLIFILNYGINPTSRMVTFGEREAMKYVNSQIQMKGYDSYSCVVAEAWPLLALQEISGNKVIGGGFPLGVEFTQPELVPIQQGMFKDPKKELMEEALHITNMRGCFLVTEKTWVTKDVLQSLVKILGPYKAIQDNYVFYYPKK